MTGFRGFSKIFESFYLGGKKPQHWRGKTFMLGDRDLARTHSACLLESQFPDLLFGQAKYSMKRFQFLTFWGLKQITKYFPDKPSSRTRLK